MDLVAHRDVEAGGGAAQCGGGHGAGSRVRGGGENGVALLRRSRAKWSINCFLNISKAVGNDIKKKERREVQFVPDLRRDITGFSTSSSRPRRTTAQAQLPDSIEGYLRSGVRLL
jgi:hypothetical protein